MFSQKLKTRKHKKGGAEPGDAKNRAIKKVLMFYTIISLQLLLAVAKDPVLLGSGKLSLTAPIPLNFFLDHPLSHPQIAIPIRSFF